MPLMNIDYTENLPNKQKMRSFILTAHQQVATLIGSDADNFKTSLNSIRHHVVGSGTTDDQKALLNITLRVLPRPEALKQQVAEHLYQAALATFQDGVGLIHIQIAVEVLDLGTNIITPKLA